MFRAPKIAKQCPASWSHMKGDDQVRHCTHCDRQVFNLSNMSEADGKALVRKHTGQRLCVRYYQRADGTVMTRDCGIAERAKVRLKAALAGVCSLVGIGLFMPVAAQGAAISPENLVRHNLRKVQRLSQEIREEKDPEVRTMLVEMRKDASDQARKALQRLKEKGS